MMDVLILAVQDNSNTAYRTYKALTSAGLRVLGFKGVPHPFHYPEQLPIHPVLTKMYENGHFWSVTKQLIPLMKQAKAVYFMHSYFCDPDEDLGIPMFYHHGGESYRAHHDAINKAVGDRFEKTVVQMPDLLDLGAKDEVYIPFSVDTDVLRLAPTKGDSIIVGHFPSPSAYRGTDEIREIIRRCKHAANVPVGSMITGDTPVVTWYEHLDRVSQCDILIENCCAESGSGSPWGEFGNSAFEAAAMGKVVITNSFNYKKYVAKFGYSEMQIANGTAELEERLMGVLKMGKKWITQRGVMTRRWVKKHHSIEATGARLRNEVFRGLLDGP